MKKNIILYLFVFTALILIFQLVNSKKIFDDLQAKWSETKVRNENLKDSIFQLQDRIDEQNDFELEGNEYALRYFENLSIENISSYVKDQLYETNLLREKNDLIPYAAMDRTFLINKVKILNHRWIIADFSDGTHWGEIFLTYQIDKKGGLTFELKEHFLYPNPD
ncbi:MAG: hydrolase [Flavobacteriaceae bacterium TMED42]|nr:MAG: hydrolase [Flavobacteriaceae bacterium TMED42]RPG68295.1 MAG: hydrolase [Flavobacteriaceae bacterium TMED42]|tara:strand:- start:7085 stop:7579 length:495 start_codon:yes stop_codon:yes gene_type:complete